MGCCLSEKFHHSVSIQHSIIHLLQVSDNHKLIKRLESQSHKQNINCQYNFQGDTLLHYAASKNNIQLTNYLLENGGNPNIRNLHNQKPIDLAKDKEIIEILTKVTKKDDPPQLRNSKQCILNLNLNQQNQNGCNQEKQSNFLDTNDAVRQDEIIIGLEIEKSEKIVKSQSIQDNENEQKTAEK